jgi:MoaA/NifB/PqqE/SkfB family radical SAM enzyme
VRLRQLVRMGTATLAARLAGKATPLNVMISVTNRCTARCGYCDIPARRQRELTTVELLALLDELKALGTQRVAFWGGEPLLRDDIGALVRHAKRRCGFFVSLDTNGRLVPERLDDLADLDVLVVSYDGPREVHDANRGEGSHARARAALELAAPRQRVFTITVLTRENLSHVDAILDDARRLGFATTFQLLHHTEGLASAGERDLLPSNEEYRATLRHLLRRKREGAAIVSSAAYLERLLRWPSYAQPTDTAPRGLRCMAGTLYANVDTDGSVYPCSGLVGRVPAANALAGGFARAFAATTRGGCGACIASCYTEYNLMHALHPGVVANWLAYTWLRPGGRRGVDAP